MLQFLSHFYILYGLSVDGALAHEGADDRWCVQVMLVTVLQVKANVMAKKTSGERTKLSPKIRQEILMEACYKCANPRCWGIITFDIHHIWPVEDNGPDELFNLIALCGYCHDMHHQGYFSEAAIRHWKGMLVALNHAFDPAGMDLLLFLKKVEGNMTFTSDGVIKFARLIAAGLVELNSFEFKEDIGNGIADIGMTQRGRMLVEAWLEGDEEKYKKALVPSGTPRNWRTE